MIGKVFKAYDIRGVYPDPLDEKMAWQIGYGCGHFLLEEAARHGDSTPMMKHIVVGRDMRSHSPSLRDALCQGMIDSGASVIDIGMVDTPFIYFAINHLDCAGGVQVTASHNPPKYNGFKISMRKAKPVGESTGLQEVRKAAATVDERIRNSVSGHIEQRDLWEAYSRHVLSFLDAEMIRKHGGMKIVIDASNGMAGTMVPKIFGKKGAAVDGLEIIELYFDNTSGDFVHDPNPLVIENLTDLRRKVLDTGADFGVCFDGDADRLMIVDERGNPIGCDLLTAFLVKGFLANNPGGGVVYDLRSSKALPESIVEAGGLPIRSRVGHVFMKAALGQNQAVFGGELSGHFYFRENFNADSGAIALAVLLSSVAASAKPVSEVFAPIRRYVQSGELNFEVEDKDAVLDELKEEYALRGDIDELDGVTVDCFESEGWWCNVRKSNTEPLLRLNVEGRDDTRLREALDSLVPMLGKPSSGH